MSYTPSTLVTLTRETLVGEGCYDETSGGTTTIATAVVAAITQSSPKNRRDTETTHSAVMAVTGVETGDVVTDSAGYVYVVTSVRVLSPVLGPGRVRVGLAYQTVVS